MFRSALLTATLAACLAGCATEQSTDTPASEPASQMEPTSQPELESQSEPALEAESAPQVETNEAMCRREAEKANMALGKDRVRTEIFGITPEMQKIYDSCMAQRPPSVAQ